MNNELKDKLDSAFARMDVVTINNMLTEYGERYPKDRDLWFYRYNLLFIQEQYDEAAEIAKMCVEHFPTSMKHIIIWVQAINMREMLWKH